MDENPEEPNDHGQVKLSQKEADRLISLEKECITKKTYAYPSPGSVLEIPVRSIDKAEKFKLTIRPGRINLTKTSDQIREKNSNLVLVRVDVGDTIGHTNPDGKTIPGNHIHLYKEGYEDKIAQPLPMEFINPKDPYQTLKDFMKYCKITYPPAINEGLDQ